MPTINKILLQTRVDTAVAHKFDALAKNMGHKRAGYLRHLVELHVKTKTPDLPTNEHAKQRPIYPRYCSKTPRAFKTLLETITPPPRKH